MQQVRNELLEHLGNRASATERMLIDRACWLALYIAKLDERIAAGKMTERMTRQYLAWTNTMRHTMSALGLRDAAPPHATLADALAAARR